MGYVTRVRTSQEDRAWSGTRGAVPEAILIIGESDRRAGAFKVRSPKKQRERWRAKLYTNHASDWADWIQAFMVKVRWTKGTCHQLRIEMLELTWEHTLDSGFEKGLWMLVELGRVEQRIGRPGESPEFRLSADISAWEFAVGEAA